MQVIAQIDYITDGTPSKTVVVATLADGTQVNLTDTVCAIDQEEGSPVCRVMIVGTAPIRDHDVLVMV